MSRSFKARVAALVRRRKAIAPDPDAPTVPDWSNAHRLPDDLRPDRAVDWLSMFGPPDVMPSQRLEDLIAAAAGTPTVAPTAGVRYAAPVDDFDAD